MIEKRRIVLIDMQGSYPKQKSSQVLVGKLASRRNHLGDACLTPSATDTNPTLQQAIAKPGAEGDIPRIEDSGGREHGDSMPAFQAVGFGS